VESRPWLCVERFDGPTSLIAHSFGTKSRGDDGQILHGANLFEEMRKSNDLSVALNMLINSTSEMKVTVLVMSKS
jgi:hypothetical protein